MAQSLRDQFLKMGLVDKTQASQAKKTTYRKNKEQDKGRIQSPDENKIHAQQALVEKKKQAQGANQKQQEAAKKAEKIAQIRQLITTNRLPLKDGVIAYRFSDSNRIAKIFVPTKEMVDGLSRGKLAIVREKNSYAVVPSTIAEKIREWQPELIVLANAAQQESQDDPDDPYAAYKIPDDLIW
ncbi:MAG: DUF2058 domain-containing protein [Proteobacteria bacterium]|jgi:uncharacterized protein YaiL (DUF2058 family)|nr:DUF2058 domain-containing protein [Desulfocapsa sp.]MBU3944050.1 DUF2058 domain-containing protein [Pseudomonadota bacterium]MCG2742801.1 DUF2058 domain-containing protein [Desulfobacteraceae bacterium]MBU3984821.1 DUF2058 domain-containing protein [Pseudomonadota bacterium]MBU4029519.1 DUF2058 domain-containing protein [Pseudomonadota bacterium]